MRRRFEFASSTWDVMLVIIPPVRGAIFPTFFADSAHARNTILYKNKKIPTPPQKNGILS